MKKLLYLPRKWKGRWWPSRTSNPVHWVNSLVGGFDSHALPPSKGSTPQGGEQAAHLPVECCQTFTIWWFQLFSGIKPNIYSAKHEILIKSAP